MKDKSGNIYMPFLAYNAMNPSRAIVQKKEDAFEDEWLHLDPVQRWIVSELGITKKQFISLRKAGTTIALLPEKRSNRVSFSNVLIMD